MQNDIIEKILLFISFAERLKCEMRHSWLSSNRQESVAEHSWQMSLLAILLYQYLEHDVDLEKVLKMIIVHDIVEAETGDIPFFEQGLRKENKFNSERKAIEKIKMMLSNNIGNEIYLLWYEFEANQTTEAKFVKALDQLEVQIQHNLAMFDTWQEIEYKLVYTKMDKYCYHDRCLRDLCNAVKLAAEVKMRNGGVNIAKLKTTLSNQNEI
ncbi:putative hydrolases of HD superfamily [Gammaproteobacteria bacterium]